MFYEEKEINGVLHYRTDPNESFKPYTLEELSARYADTTECLERARSNSEPIKNILMRIILLDDECQEPDYAEDNKSILLIIKDIAKKSRPIVKEFLKETK